MADAAYNGHCAVDIEYLRDKNVHVLFDNIVKYLLRCKPARPRRALLKLMRARQAQARSPRFEGPLDGTARSFPNYGDYLESTAGKSFDRDASFLDSTASATLHNSSKASCVTPVPGSLMQRKRVGFKSESEIHDVLAITDIETRRARGDYYEDGEEEALKADQDPTNECYFCCHEPNDCEWSLFSLYEEIDGAGWFLVCGEDKCIAQVKEWWRFAYTMGDTLTRLEPSALRVLFSFLPPGDRQTAGVLCSSFRNIFWEEVDLSRVKTPERVEDVVSAYPFARNVKVLRVRDVPALGITAENDALDFFIAQVSEAAGLEEVEVVRCGVALSDYARIATSGLRASVGTLKRLVIGPLSEESERAETSDSVAQLLLSLRPNQAEHKTELVVCGEVGKALRDNLEDGAGGVWRGWQSPT
eukprot:Hpha_TRINITY_DN12617_c0_g1::TRINITY_DN12617_c0_g1_i2::g.49550::m.49550